jgi:uncharacterized protein (DUF2062 family)
VIRRVRNRVERFIKEAPEGMPRKPSDLLKWSRIRRFLAAEFSADQPPRRIARSLALGFISAMLPFPGHTFFTIIVAGVLRWNIPLALAATWSNLPFLLPFTYGFAFAVGTLITGVSTPAIDWSRFMEPSYLFPLLGTAYIPMCVGSLVVGGAVAVIAYVVSYTVATRIQARKSAGDDTTNQHEPVE